MTSAELKKTIPMRQVVESYGLRPNRSGFVRCPFHQGDNTASLKIYRDNFHCFGCHADGDIFDFVMRMDGVPFKEAFRTLGGTYKHGANFAAYHAMKARDARIRRAEARKKAERTNNRLIYQLRELADVLEPFSYAWCRVQKELDRQWAIFDDLHGDDNGSNQFDKGKPTV